MNDSINDFITRLKNASMADKAEVQSPHSKLRENLAKLLASQGLIADYQVDESSGFKNLVVHLVKTKVKVNRLETVIISKPGRRVYAHSSQLKKLNLGRSILIISTPQGLMTANQAMKANLGGELICRFSFK